MAIHNADLLSIINKQESVIMKIRKIGALIAVITALSTTVSFASGQGATLLPGHSLPVNQSYVFSGKLFKSKQIDCEVLSESVDELPLQFYSQKKNTAVDGLIVKEKATFIKNVKIESILRLIIEPRGNLLVTNLSEAPIVLKCSEWCVF